MRRLRIFLQISLLLTVLASIPYLGVELMLESQRALVTSQKESQLHIAEAISQSLFDNSDLQEINRKSVQSYLTPYYLTERISVDGFGFDWLEQEIEEQVFPPIGDSDDLLRVGVRVGEWDDAFYFGFNVHDGSKTQANPMASGHALSDHIRFEWVGVAGETMRLALVPESDGLVWYRFYDESWRFEERVDSGDLESIKADVQIVGDSYYLELKLPKSMLDEQEKVRFEVVDHNTGRSVTNGLENEAFHSLNRNEITIKPYLNRYAGADFTTEIYDKQSSLVGRSLIQDKTDLVAPSSFSDDLMYSINRFLFSKVSRPLGGNQPANEKQLAQVSNLGEKAHASWETLAGKGYFVTSVPIWNRSDDVIGVVLLKQSTDPVIQSQQTQLQLIIVASLVLVPGLFLGIMYLFGRLALRIKNLKDEASNMVDMDGTLLKARIRSSSDANDSVGDLSRSFSDIMARLHEHQSFLAHMPRTLSHEIKNPLNAISTSIENVSDFDLDEEVKGYMDVAKKGLHRIESILNKLSAAATLEQALTLDDIEPFNLNQFLAIYISHQDRIAGSDCNIVYKGINEEALIEAVDYRLEQAFDKLLDNAKDFRKPDTDIIVTLLEVKNQWVVTVENEGPLIDLEKKNQLFASMVSQRSDAKPGGDGHFGLGLYVVRTIAHYHNAAVDVVNLPDGSGVSFSISFPKAHS